MNKKLVIGSGLAAIVLVTGIAAANGSDTPTPVASPNSSATPTPTPTPSVPTKLFTAATVAQVQECATAIENAASVASVRYSKPEYDTAETACDKAKTLVTYDGGVITKINVDISQEMLYLSLTNLASLSGDLGSPDWVAHPSRWTDFDGEGRATLERIVTVATTATR